MKINIIGNGVFGSFLSELLVDKTHVATLDNDADIVILAVPFDAFDEVASKHAGKLLINVCSIQKESTEICLKHSDSVVSIHPMFGKRTPDNVQKTCILTHRSDMNDKLQDLVIDMFRGSGTVIEDKQPDGSPMTPEWHDRLMANSHCKALDIAESAMKELESIKDIPARFLPASVIKLRELAMQLQDMPEGTRSSIRANSFLES